MHQRLLGLTIFVASALMCQAALAAPKLTLPEEEWNFGYVPQNARISHIFWLKSTGDDSLKIVNVIPGCGCTKAPLEKNALGIGDSTRLEIQFDTRSYTNQVSKAPTIQTNEGTSDRNVRFQANVVARPDSTYPVVMAPYKIDLMESNGKARHSAKLTIKNISDKDLIPTLVDVSSDYLQVNMPKVVSAGKSAEAMVNLTAKGEQEDFEKSFTIQFNDDKASRFTVPVKRILRVTQATASQVEPTGAH